MTIMQATRPPPVAILPAQTQLRTAQDLFIRRWGEMVKFRDQLLRFAERRGTTPVAQLKEELDAMGPIGFWHGSSLPGRTRVRSGPIGESSRNDGASAPD